MDGLKIIALIVSALAAICFVVAVGFYLSGRMERYEYPRRDAWDAARVALMVGLAFAIAAGISWFIALGGLR